MRTISSLLLALLCAAATAQAPDQLVTKDGRQLSGRIVDRGIDAVTFDDAELGEVRVPFTAIRALRPGGRAVTIFDPAWSAAEADVEPSESGYVTWVPGDGGEPDRLMTGSARWRHEPTGTVVLLVGVTHIGEQAYFEELQARLDTCDVVLFESVARGAATADELAKLDVLMRVQLMLRDALGLEFQKDAMDYERGFWHRADVDLDRLQRALEQRGAGLPTDDPMIRGLLRTATTAAQGGAGQRSPVVRARAARLLGPALAQADRVLSRPGLDGLRGALIEDRNDAALAELRRELSEGPHGRKIAVFYGAAHLPHFDERLGADPAFAFEGVEWEAAWTVPADDDLPSVDRRAIHEAIDAAKARFDDRLEVAVWLGRDVGPSTYERDADDVMAAASSIKTAYLVELFDEFEGRLDEPLPGLGAIVTDADHPAVVHFPPEVQQQIVDDMRGASVRRVAQMMIHGIGVTNEVYNAAANVTTAVLGGPEGLTERLARRFGEGAAVRRYMLAARDVTGDNEVSARFLARTLQALARGELRGVDPRTVQAMRDQLFVRERATGRRHHSKTGSLDSDPMTRIRSGFVTAPGEPPLVYVVMIELPDPGDEPRDEVASRLEATVAELTDAALAAARRRE